MINKETITFNEFRAWLTGLIVGKRGELPDLEDWKQIKEMLDKVVAEKETITIPQIQPTRPHPDLVPIQVPTPQPHWTDHTGYPPYGTWCSGSTVTVGGSFGDSVGTFNDVSMSFTDNTQLELNLEDTGVQATTGLVQVNITEESMKLGEELQRMIDEVEHGQKESS